MSDDTVSWEFVEFLYSEEGVRQMLSQTTSAKRLWHIAMPKSGSSWLSQIFMNIFDNQRWHWAGLCPSYGNRAQEIDPRHLLSDAWRTSNIFYIHQHCVCSEYTDYLVKLTQMNCILQVRNLFDVAVSTRDFYRKIIEFGGPESALVPQSLRGSSDDVLLDYVISIEMPWVFKFVDGWFNSSLINEGRLLKVSYEELLQDATHVVKQIVDFAEFDVSTDVIEKAVEEAGGQETRTLKNKGIIGRGKEILSQEQIEHILHMADFFDLRDHELLSLS